MAQKGTEAQCLFLLFEKKRRKRSHLKSTTHLFTTQQARGPYCYSEEWGQCLGRPAQASTPSPTEVHGYMVPLTSPFGFGFFPSPSCQQLLDPMCKYIFTITS